MFFYFFLCLFFSFSLGGVIHQWSSYEDRRVSTNNYPNNHGKHEASEGFPTEDEYRQEGKQGSKGGVQRTA